MNVFLKIIGIALLLQAKLIIAQDMHLTQFYASPMYVNPAFTGANVCTRVSLVYRNQWPGVSNSYRSMLMALDHTAKNKNIGIGLMLSSDEAGAGNLKTTVISPAMSYQARLNKRSLLRFGLQSGIAFKSMNFNNLKFGDQIYRGGNVATLETPTQNKLYFDMAAGALYIYGNHWGGISLYHINRPNDSFYDDPNNRLPVNYSIQIGTKVDLSKGERAEQHKTYLLPVLHYNGQNKFDQIDLGVYLTRHIFTLGAWYRGIPGLKSYRHGYQNNDAMAFICGLQTEKIKVGYSYDITVSNLSHISNGAHEVTLSFQLCNAKTRKPKYQLIYCPKF